MGRVRSLHSACPAQPHDRVLVELWICGVCGGVRVGQPHGPASPSLVLTNYLSVAWPLCTRCPPLPPPPLALITHLWSPHTLRLQHTNHVDL